MFACGESIWCVEETITKGWRPSVPVPSRFIWSPVGSPEAHRGGRRHSGGRTLVDRGLHAHGDVAKAAFLADRIENPLGADVAVRLTEEMRQLVRRPDALDRSVRSDAHLVRDDFH